MLKYALDLLIKIEPLLPSLYRAGLINKSIYLALPIRQKRDALMRSGKSNGEAVAIIAKQMRMSRTTIYRYLEITKSPKTYPE